MVLQGANGMKGEKGDAGLPGAQGPSVSLSVLLQWIQQSRNGSLAFKSEERFIFKADLS